MTDETTDEELLDRFCHQQDDEAFQSLMKRHYDWVFATCRSYLDKTADAEDGCQQVFVQLAHKAHVIRDRTALVAWLQQVIRGVTADMLRVNVHRRRHETCVEHLPQVQFGGSQVVSQLSVARQSLPTMLEQLDPTDRDIVQRFYLQRESFQDIAHRMGVNYATVRKRGSRAIVQLRKLYQRQGINLTGAVLMTLFKPTEARELALVWSPSNLSHLVQHDITNIQSATSPSVLRSGISPRARPWDNKFIGGIRRILQHVVISRNRLANAVLGFAVLIASVSVLVVWLVESTTPFQASVVTASNAYIRSTVHDSTKRLLSIGDIVSDDDMISVGVDGFVRVETIAGVELQVYADSVVSLVDGQWMLQRGMLSTASSTALSPAASSVIQWSSPRMSGTVSGNASVMSVSDFDRFDLHTGEGHVDDFPSIQAGQAVAAGVGCSSEVFSAAPVSLSHQDGGILFAQESHDYRQGLQLRQGPRDLQLIKDVPLAQLVQRGVISDPLTGTYNDQKSSITVTNTSSSEHTWNLPFPSADIPVGHVWVAQVDMRIVGHTRGWEYGDGSSSINIHHTLGEWFTFSSVSAPC